MKTLLPLIAVALLTAGCASATRTSMTSAEAFHQFAFPHSLSRDAAFARTEVALAESFNDYTQVLKLRQPESGTFLLKALVPFQVVGVTKYADYTLKTTVLDSAVRMEFTLESMPQTGIYAPADQIPKIHARFRSLAEQVARSLDSQLDP